MDDSDDSDDSDDNDELNMWTCVRIGATSHSPWHLCMREHRKQRMEMHRMLPWLLDLVVVALHESMPVLEQQLPQQARYLSKIQKQTTTMWVKARHVIS
jgi:hypothetical protein